MSELLYNKSKAVEELNKVEGFYPLELARVISNEGQEEQRYLDVKYRKLWFRLVNPTGKIISRIVHFTENMAVVEARIYLDKCDQEDNYIANSFSQKFRTADIQFGDKFLEMAETAAIGRALADAGYGLQFADVGEGNDPMQVDAGIPVNQGTQMQTAMPAQTPAPGMQQTPNQSAGTMPSFPPQATPGQQMMEQFYQEAQANGNTIGGVTGTGQMTNPVMSPATGSVPVMQQMPSKPQFLDPNMPVEELVKWMSYEQAIQVAVTGQGKFSGKTMGQVAIERDNDYYLHHLITGENHKSGSIFMDFHNQENLSDRNSIIYGHNMKDGSMFGTLDQYQSQALYRNYPCFYMYVPGYIYEYQIFSCYAAPTDHPAYTYDFPTSEDYEVFLETLQRSAEYNTGMTVTEEDQVVTLSTCVNTRKDYRYLVHGKLKQKIKMEE